MWRRLISPEALFSLSALLALLPYVSFALDPDSVIQDYPTLITFGPLLLWVIALIAFLGGAAVSSMVFEEPRSRPHAHAAPLHGRVTASIAALIIVVWIQIGAAISFFGVVPLLAYGADFTVEDVHDRLTDAPSGQFGLLTLSSFVLVALVIGLVAGRERWALRDRSIATLGLITAAFVGVFLGKAQGFVIQLAMLLTAAILLEGHPLNPFLRRMNLGTMSPGATAVFTILAFLALVSFFGWSRNLRIGDEETWAFSAGLQHVMRYLSWPLINSEEIVQHQTLFAERTDPLGFLRGLLPYGWIERDDYLLSILPEPSSPIGFVGHAYWYGGIVGLTVYAFLVGLGMKALFLRSRHSLLPVLVYAQGSWALFAAQSYNHFVTLIFFPLPALAYAFLAFFLVARERRAGGAYVPRAR